MNEALPPALRGAARALLAPNPSPMTLDGTRVYIVGRRRPIVIDPGPADEHHLSRLSDALAGAAPAAILLTHHHPDHAAAATALAAETGAPVCMARGALDVGFPAVEPDRWIDDGDRFETDAGSICATATPGHAPEHLAFHWDGTGLPGGVLFVGDLLMGVGDTSLVAPPEGDLAAYLRSLDRVRVLGPGVLVPSHGPPIEDVERTLERYVRHRWERVQRVERALLERGESAPAELVEVVYGGALDPRLREAAAASILASLLYLQGHGRARPTGAGHFVPTDGSDRPALRSDFDPRS